MARRPDLRPVAVATPPPQPVGPPASPATPVAADRPLELAAMLLLPTDLGPNFGVVDSYVQSLDEVVEGQAEYRGDDPAAVRAALEAAGWRRQHAIAVAAQAEPPNRGASCFGCGSGRP